MAAVTICSYFRTQEEEIYQYSHLFSFYLPWSNGAWCHGLVFLIFNFKLTLLFSSFTFIKRHFSSSSFSAIRMVSSVYLRFVMFLPPILIPACNSSSLAFLMMCSAHRLNKQVTTESTVILLSQSWTNQLFHPGFHLLLLNLHTGFSEDRWDGLVSACL